MITPTVKMIPCHSCDKFIGRVAQVDTRNDHWHFQEFELDKHYQKGESYVIKCSQCGAENRLQLSSPPEIAPDYIDPLWPFSSSR